MFAVLSSSGHSQEDPGRCQHAGAVQHGDAADRETRLPGQVPHAGGDGPHLPRHVPRGAVPDMSCSPPAGGLAPGLTSLWVLLWMSPARGLQSLQIPLGQCHVSGDAVLEDGPVKITPGLDCSPLKPARFNGLVNRKQK